MLQTRAVQRIASATVLIGALVWGKHYRDSSTPASDERWEETSSATQPAVRVAREAKPTIVESNANWLDQANTAHASPTDTAELSPPETQPLLSVPQPPHDDTSVQR